MKDDFKNWQEENIEELEIESGDDGSGAEDDISVPYDPKQVKIYTSPSTIDNLVQRLRHNEIDLNTEFQRKGNLWKPDAQSRLIESILLRFPLPPLYFDTEDEDSWKIVDGLQRLWTFKNFIVDQTLELNGLEILTEYNGKKIKFDNLNRAMQRRLLETNVTTYQIQPGTPKQVKYHVFRRINTGGLGLNPMEIRHALNQGKAANFMKRLSENEALRNMLPLPDKRMEDRELYLRTIAFMFRPYSEYKKPLTSFLDTTMELLGDQSSQQLNQIELNIVGAIAIQKTLFDKHAFSRSFGEKDWRYKLNSALFETWVSLTSVLKKEEIKNLIANKAVLQKAYRLLLRDTIFAKSISSSTSDKSAVNVRFSHIEALINNYKKTIPIEPQLVLNINE